MNALSKLATGGKFTVFNLESIVGFSDTSTTTTTKVKITLSGGTSVEIKYVFKDFLEKYLKYKRGGITLADFALDDAKNPINGLIKLHKD